VILAAGEPDFDTPEIVREAGIKAINDGFSKYTPAAGTLQLKEAICRKFSNENGLSYEPSEIVVSCGAKHSLYNLFQVICDPGDEVIVIQPYWLSYPAMVKLAGGEPVFVKTTVENGFNPDIEDIRSAITDKTKAIVINSPSNPAGIIYDEEKLKQIAGLCLENDIIIVSDEIYEKIIFDEKSHFSIASVSEDVKKNTVIVNGVSKSFAMTGWRIGYIAGDKDLVKKIVTLQSQSTSNPCSIAQKAAECALTADLSEFITKNAAEFQKRRDLLINLLSEIDGVRPVKPQGAFYMFCDISSSGMDSVTFAEKLLEEKEVAVIPGGPFGEDGFVRISFATSEKMLEEGVGRIREWMSAAV